MAHARPAFNRVSAAFSAVVVGLLTGTIRIYQLGVTPAQTFLFGPSGCRFTPSCSAYAREALRTHGVLAGATLATRRICRCHPWGGCGHDPVPKAASPNASAATQP